MYLDELHVKPGSLSNMQRTALLVAAGIKSTQLRPKVWKSVEKYVDKNHKLTTLGEILVMEMLNSGKKSTS